MIEVFVGEADSMAEAAASAQQQFKDWRAQHWDTILLDVKIATTATETTGINGSMWCTCTIMAVW